MTEEQMQQALDKKFGTVVEDVTKITQEQEKTAEALEKANTAIAEVGETLEEFLAKQAAEYVETFDKQFKAFLTENKEAIAKLKTQKSGIITFIPKAAEDITTGSGTINRTNMNIDNDQSLSGGFNLANYQFVDNMVTVLSTNTESFPYTELKPKEGNFEWVAEGAEKPKIDFTWVTNYAKPIKVAAYEILTDEVVRDVPRMMSTAKDYLKRKHDISRSKKIIEIAIAEARTFNAGAMAAKIVEPTFMDVVNAVVTDVYTVHAYEDEAHYIPNVVMINPMDFFINFVSAKDSEGKPLYPTASLFSSITIGGIKIIPTRLIPTGKLFVADMKYFNVTRWESYSVSIGWINDQFIHNKFTMLGESRMHAFIKEHQKGVFVYDDFDTVKTAITKL